MTGIYYLPLPIISHETGMTMGEVIDALTFLAGIDFAHYDGVDELVWVPAMAAWQIDEELKPGDKRVLGIRRELGAFRGHRFVREFFERYGQLFNLGNQGPSAAQEAPSKALRSQEQEQEQDQEQEQEHEQEQETDSSAVAQTTPPEPPVLTFPCAGKISSWGLTTTQVAEWQESFPAVDVMLESRAALAWVKANQKKTYKGMPAFLVRWFGNSQNRASGARGSPRASPGQQIFEANRTWAEGGRP
ncbi:MAG: hypothetical protein ABJA82_00485 [Myxococcales bacterium]